jgi:hypothetical protein
VLGIAFVSLGEGIDAAGRQAADAHTRCDRGVRTGTYPRTSPGGPTPRQNARTTARASSEGSNDDRDPWRVCARRGAVVGRFQIHRRSVDQRGKDPAVRERARSLNTDGMDSSRFSGIIAGNC